MSLVSWVDNFLFTFLFLFKQKTAYEMRISDWSSDVCSSDLELRHLDHHGAETRLPVVRFLALLVCRCRLSGRFRQLRPQRPALAQGPIRLRRPARAAHLVERAHQEAGDRKSVV